MEDRMIVEVEAETNEMNLSEVGERAGVEFESAAELGPT